MTLTDEKKIKDLIHSIGLLNNLTDNQVKEIVESQFRFAYEQIRKVSYTTLTEEEIDNLKTNFYFKYIGKIYTDSMIIKHHKNKSQKIKEKIDERNKGL